MHTKDTISVVIPVYNGESFLADAIESIIAQQASVAEIIVIDDGSTDDSAGIARQYAAVNYIYQDNAGAAAARNHGATLATGDFLAFLDADDVWMPDKLTRQLAAFATDSDLDVVFGHARQVQIIKPGKSGDSGDLTSKNLQYEVLPARLPSAMLIRRDAFQRVGAYDKQWRLGEVVDWYNRAVEAGLKMHMLPEILYERRLHDDNLGKREQQFRSDYLAVVKAALDRRRAR